MSKFTKYCKGCHYYINSRDWLFTKSNKWVCVICFKIDDYDSNIELCNNSEHNNSNIDLCNNSEHIMVYKKKTTDTKYCEGCHKHINNVNIINGNITKSLKWLCFNCFRDHKINTDQYCSTGCGMSYDPKNYYAFITCDYKKCNNIMCIECDYNNGYCDDCLDCGYNDISDEDNKNEDDADENEYN